MIPYRIHLPSERQVTCEVNPVLKVYSWIRYYFHWITAIHSFYIHCLELYDHCYLTLRYTVKPMMDLLGMVQPNRSLYHEQSYCEDYALLKQKLTRQTLDFGLHNHSVIRNYYGVKVAYLEAAYNLKPFFSWKEAHHFVKMVDVQLHCRMNYARNQRLKN